MAKEKSQEELRQLARKIAGHDEIGGFVFNEDLSSLQVVLFVDEAIFETVYLRNDETGAYELKHMRCLSRARL